TFRDALSAEYKATRAAMPDDLVRQLPYVQRLFEALRIPVIEVAGFEADDVLATLVARALARPDLEVVIVTGDKDLLQLVGPRVRVLSVSGRTGGSRVPTRSLAWKATRRGAQTRVPRRPGVV